MTSRILLRRLLALAIAACSTMALVGCGGGGTDEPENVTPLNATLLLKSDPAGAGDAAGAGCTAGNTDGCAAPGR
jgi:hypothetical protein